ncbi:MAG: thymidine phosphorylase [Verrucomicrobiota bacterium]
MLPQWIIEKKRDKLELSSEEIAFFIEQYTTGDIPDYQMAAMAMAIYLNGMNFDEMSCLTECMMNSGDIVDTSSIDRPKSDKHSTGGIGDKVSLILAPLVACCDIAVPMISGRGLGITGGTLDKLESIPGYNTRLEEPAFIKVVDRCGCSIIGQTDRLAPADRKLYALRDVTATVPSIPLIVASIMFKKLAEGIDSLVLDVKCGKGAFMKTPEDAGDLARALVEVGRKMGKGTSAIISGMNQPLGKTAGNALEVVETVECLTGQAPDPELMEITLALCVRMIRMAGAADDDAEAMATLRDHLNSGRAFEKFKQMVELQGGDPSSMDQPERLPQASIVQHLEAERAGTVSDVDAEKIGRGVLILGAGRAKTEDDVDHAVGVSGLVKIGAQIEAGQPLLTIHANDNKRLEEALSWFKEAITLSEDPATPPPLIIESIT